MLVSCVELSADPPINEPMEEVLAMAPTSSTSSIFLKISTTRSVTSAVSLNGVVSGSSKVMVICVLSMVGINAVPLESEARALPTSSTRTPIKITALCFKDQSRTFP